MLQYDLWISLPIPQWSLYFSQHLQNFAMSTEKRVSLVGSLVTFFFAILSSCLEQGNKTYFSFQRELSNGSIFHKRHKTLFNREDYEIYHFQVGELQEEGFDRVYKVCSTESLINVSIIQGAKKPYLFLDSSYTLRTLPMPAARPLVDL